MATTIKLKNGSGAPSASDLVQGEPAIDLTNKRLYTENGSGAVIEVGSNPSSLSIAGTAVTATAAELNILDGVTSTAAELNILDGVTATAAELNILDGVTSTAAELNILDGVTSTAAELNILDGVTSTTAELNILDGVTSTTAELNILDGVTSTAAELNVLDGVTAFVDEDDMSSDSATSIPSQQSVKAYVDSVATASDLDFQADSGGALNIDLDSETITFTGGTGVDTSGSGNAVTFAIDSTVTTLTGSQTLTNKTLTSPVLNTGVSGTAVLDEDDMSSDSATQLATQQSIKAYVDSQVASADTLAELTDTNVTSPADAALLFYDTGTSKWIDNVVSGDVTIADTGVAAIGSGVIVNDDVNASAAISVSKTALTAGTGITLSTDTLSVDASQTQITAVGTIGTGTWQGSVISDTYVANDLTISGGTIENTIIGASTAAAGTFTTFTSTGIDDNATSTAITIDASENVGIGTTSPAVELEVASAAPQLRLTDTDGGYCEVTNVSGNLLLQADKGDTEASSSMRFDVDGTERMRIDSTGNVGIGTTSPSSTTSAGPTLEISGTAGGNLVLSDSNATSGQRAKYLLSQGGALYVGHSADNGTSPVNDLVINASGNVGIGTTSPDEKLHVVGEILCGADASTSGQVILKSEYVSSSNDFINILGTERSTSSWVIGYGVKPSPTTADVFLSTADNSAFERGALVIDDELVFMNAGSQSVAVDSAVTMTDRMRIRENGQLLLGGTVNSPANVRMVVFGTGNATGVYNTGHTGIHINNNAATAGLGNYGAGLSFGRFGGSSDDNSAMIVPVQTTSDEDHMGISFFTHNTNTRGNPLGEVMRINSTGQLIVAGTTSGFDTTPAVNGLQAHYETDTGEATLGSYSSGGSTFMTFHTNSGGGASSEHMRIDSSGNLLVGKTSASGTTLGPELRANGQINAASAGDFLNMYSTSASAYRFYVTNAGKINATSDSIQAISDASLKENIRDLDKGLETINALQPRRFDWKNGDGNDIMGFVAQEVQGPLPEIVHDQKYNEFENKLALSTGNMIPVMVKAIQELSAQITELKAEVAALKGE